MQLPVRVPESSTLKRVKFTKGQGPANTLKGFAGSLNHEDVIELSALLKAAIEIQACRSAFP